MKWWWNRAREERELDDELRFHLDQEAQLRRERGQDPAGARRDFGNLALVRETTREAWAWTTLERTAQDARLTLRLLRKSPSFTVTALAVLALGIGAVTAMFSVVHSVLLRPLPFPDPDRLMMVWERQPSGRTNVIQTGNFLAWRERNRGFTGIAAMLPIATNLSGDGEPVQVPGMRVTAGFFEVMGVAPLAGRAIAPSDDVPGAPCAAVISYGLWQRRFGGGSAAVGRKITVEGSPCQIIGVMPEGFAFPTRRADIYTAPRITQDQAMRDGRNYSAVARLKPGVTLLDAQRDMEAVAAQTERERPNMNTHWSATVILLLEQTVGKTRQALVVLLGAVGAVLLIACANVSNLLLMRAAGRRREMTVRAALGAGRFRLIHQTAVESLILALAAGLLGYLLAWWCVPAALRMLPENFPLPRLSEIAVDRSLLWFSLGLAMVCATIFGIVPALQVDLGHIADGLRLGGRHGSAGGGRLRNGLVVAEVAIAVLLVAGAGLMLRSFVLLNNVDPGFHADHVVTLRMMLQFSKYAPNLARRAAVVQEMLERVRVQPGVTAASSIHVLPMGGGNSGTGYHRSDRPEPPPGSGTGGEVSVVSEDYFRTMGIALIAGRDFDARDRIGSPGVAILNQSAAKYLYPGEEPLGKRLKVFWSPLTEVEVVGVAADIRHDGLNYRPEPCLFVCNRQAPSMMASLLVRTAGPAAAAVAAVREQMRQVDPDQGVAQVATLEQLVGDSIAEPRLYATLFAAFGALALGLACVGIYAVISYSVEQRSREMGIRLALGAAPALILRLVLREGLVLACIGVGVGIAAALTLTRYLETLLYTVKPTDPGVFAAVGALLLAAAAAGCWFPARRATIVDPVVVLREE
jgi:putative ABC transport system permease protein